MATSKVSVVASHPQVVVTESIPKTFHEALRLGWTVAKEETAIGIDRKTREGVVLLRLKGSAVQLRVPYTGTAKAFSFGTPEAISVA